MRDNFFLIVNVTNCIPQVIADSDHLFVHVDPRWPGSVHDSHCLNMSDVSEASNTGLLDDFFFLGDSG